MLIVWVDGSPTKVAIVYEQDGKVTMDVGELPIAVTSNQAEYLALIKALESDEVAFCHDPVRVYSDSELMVKQLNGQYRVRNSGLKYLFCIAKGLLQKENVVLSWIHRESNKAGKVLEGMK